MIRLLLLLALASSYRIDTTGDGLVRMFRSIFDRLDRIESLAFLGRGKISFGPTIQIGDVELFVVNGSGNTRILKARNVLNGNTSTIATL